MGVIKKGSLLDGVTGRVGDLVLRRQGDRTIVSHRPRGQKTKQPTTETRQKTLDRFQEAVAFAKEARHRRAYRSLSRLLGRFSPYHVALQDFLSEPAIEEVDDSLVSLKGGELTILVSETVAVRSVRIKMPALEEIPLELRRSGGGPQALSESLGEKSGKARLPIPAALFFQRPETEADSSGSTAQRQTPAPDEAPEVTNDELEALPTGRIGIYAQRAASLEAGDPGEGHTEAWKVLLPRAGRIEVIASDYAGNSTRQKSWVGPRF